MRSVSQARFQRAVHELVALVHAQAGEGFGRHTGLNGLPVGGDSGQRNGRVGKDFADKECDFGGSERHGSGLVREQDVCQEGQSQIS